MRFGYPIFLAGIPVLIAVLSIVLGLAARRRRKLLEVFTGDPQRFWSAPGSSRARAGFKYVLLFFGMACLLVALARPMYFDASDVPELEGIPYLVAIDASRSMLATDVKPTRYAAVTNALDTWLGESHADRGGIITFAGAAYLNAPLTFDSTALQTILRYIAPEDITEGGSSISTAIDRAAKYFVSNNIARRILIVISDGEELEGNAIEATRKARRQSGLMVFTIGVGTFAGGKVPAKRNSREQPRSQKNTFGQEVVSRLDEGNLKRIANAGAGRYFPLGQNGEGLQQLREFVLRPMAEQAARDNLKNYKEGFQIPLAAGLLCLALKLLIEGETVSRRPQSSPRLVRT